ncbi:MAG: chitobiase/beta-hexosaminidase C-terminal domain-containing protein [Planctomycetota bacterium]
MKPALLSGAIFSLLTFTGPAVGQVVIPEGFPTAATTGIAGVGLTVDDLTDMGYHTVTVDGTVLERKRFGKLVIQADNVTVRECYFASGSPYGLQNTDNHAGLLVEDCTFVGTGESVGIIGLYTMRRCDISGFQDGAKIRSGCILEDNYIHDLWKTAESHNDGIQRQHGNNLVGAVIRHNTILGPYQAGTSAIIIGADAGITVDNVTIADNFFSGGSYCVYLRNNDGGTGPINTSVHHNVWQVGSWLYQPLQLYGVASNQSYCNVDQDGRPMTAINDWCNLTATPTITPAGGHYAGATTVTLACATPGAEIRYTTDHTDVTATSPLYTGPFTLTGDAHVKARAFAPGLDSSLPAFAAFDLDVNIAPVADAGADQELADSDNDGVEDVALDGSGSSDADGHIVAYDWTEADAPLASGVAPTVTMAAGEHTVDLTVTDDRGGTGVDTVVIMIHDDRRTVAIGCSAADQEVHSTGALVWNGRDHLRVGGATDGADGAAILPFQLPPPAAGEQIVAAQLDVSFKYTSNNPAGAVDLYGLGYRSSAGAQASDFYQGAFGGDATDAWPLQDDFVTKQTPDWSIVATDLTGDANLLAYVAAQYAAGATEGDFLLLRLNPDADNVSNYHYWRFGSADTSDATVLTLTIASAARPSDADGDGDVDLDDFVILKTNFGATSGATQAEGDFDGDGDVDLDDFVILKTHFGT